MSLNLLPSEAKFQAQRMRIKAIVNNFLWVIGGIWVLMLVIVFGVGFFLSWRVNQLDKKYQTKLNSYKSMIEEVALTQKIKYQTKVVAKVLESRFEYGKAMNLVNVIFSEKVRIDDIQIGEKKSFEVSGGSLDGSVMNEVEEKVLEINNGQWDGFDSAKITKLEVGKDKGWLFTIELFLK